GLACTCMAAERPDTHCPNILFILTEDQGPHLSHVGTPGVQTPHMDALARSGTYFRNAYVVYPVCSASKAAIMTGLHNHANGLLNNTANYHKPAAELTPAERQRSVYRSNRVRESVPTLTELLREAGYYQGVTHKLHVAPNEKFPYDEFLRKPSREAAAAFIERAEQAGKPWFLLYNVPNSHRPYPNSDRVKIRVNSGDVSLPAFLPDTPIVRQDWAEYLAAVEETDALVGEALEALKASGQEDKTIVIFMGDHGPCFQHGKMSLYELGLRVPLVVRVPGLPAGDTDALASEVDLMPTLLDLLGREPPATTHGVSLRPVLEQRRDAKPREFVFAQISHLGPLPNDGMQERSVGDGRWKLIYREKVETKWRQVNADLKLPKPWGNRSYHETVRVKDQFPEAFRVLAEMDPQSLGGDVPRLELYGLKNDPDEMHNLIGQPEHRATAARLQAALAAWAEETGDRFIDRSQLLADADEGAGIRDLMADTWVATDALGRTLPGHEECGPPRPNRYVGIFYFVWHGSHGVRGPFDISKMLSANRSNPAWGPPGAFHHWGEPELGYYLAEDTFVLRRHASMLADAGVDVAVIDVTNAFTYDKQVDALCETWLAMRREGNAPPGIAFLTHSRNAETVTHLYQRLYATGKYRDLWFLWRGKPLIMASPKGLSHEIREFFTIRESWAWTHSQWFGDGRDKWPWIDNSPQGFGWHERGVPEQMAVAVGGHPVANLGRSHHGGKQPEEPAAQTERGIYFQEQWSRALEVDPQFVFVTGWNEWVAQRFVKAERGGARAMLGRVLQPGDTYFVDQFSQEFSRDIEPMLGGHGDNYYYQLVANVRRFKGVRPMPAFRGPKEIRIDGDFSDWRDVEPEYLDTIGDVAHRDHQGWGTAGRYVDRAGRNDFVALKAAADDNHLFFYAETRNAMTPPEGDRWMLLWIDTDCDPQTGWQGYDIVVNRKVGEARKSSVEKLDSDAQPVLVGQATLAFRGNELELELPAHLLGATAGKSFDFHWTDNVRPSENGEDAAASADHAPNGRFRYRFRAA
ncbi:MAG: sulfatase-like hydrolase/transferase, partial [Planctomycetota bacterium]